jgi:hypothetical protein
MSEKAFSGPVIDRDVFGQELPAHYESDIPYFDVVNDRADPLTAKKFRFWFEPKRGGWVWDSKSG